MKFWNIFLSAYLNKVVHDIAEFKIRKNTFVFKKETHNFLNIDEERQESNGMKYSWEKYTSNFFLNLILAWLHSWIQNEHSVKLTNGSHFNFFISRLNNLLWQISSFVWFYPPPTHYRQFIPIIIWTQFYFV